MEEELDRVNRMYAEEYTLAIVLVSIVVVVGVTGGAFAFIYYGWKAQKSVSQFFITSLSLNDVITNFILIDDVVDLCFTVKYRSVFACKTFWVLKHWFVGNSLLFMVAIAIERYRRVCHPFKKQFTLKTAQLFIIVIVLISLLLSARYLATSDVIRNKLTPDVNTTRGYYCALSEEREMKSIEDVFHYLDICMHSVIICSLIGLYSLIIRTIIISNKRSHNTVTIISYHRKQAENKSSDVSRTEVVEIQTEASQDFTSVSKSEYTNAPKYDQSEKSVTEHESATFPNNNDGNATMRRHMPNPFKRQKKKNRMSLSSRLEMKVTITVAAITLASLLCFVPYYLSMLLVENDMSGQGLILSVGNVIWRRTFMLNSVINPFIMAIFNEGFRLFVVNVFKCRSYGRI